MHTVISRQLPRSPQGSLREFLGLLFSGRMIEGEYASLFEKAFADYAGARHAIAFSSARTGLFLLLRSLKLKDGDEVIVPSFTCPVVPAIVVAAGGRPVFADSKISTHNMDENEVDALVTAKTKAVIATHIEGVPCNLNRIIKTADERGIAVIEDCAQALGAKYRGRQVGTFGRASYFSFAFGKQLNTMGGGMVLTNDDALASHIREEVKVFKHQKAGKITRKYLFQLMLDVFLTPWLFSISVYPLILLSVYLSKDLINAVFEDRGAIDGIENNKYKYPNFQAALGLEKINSMETLNQKRRNNALYLRGLLRDKCKFQEPEENGEPVYCYLSLRSKERAVLKRKLLIRGIDTQESWNRACSRLEMFKAYARKCKNAEELDDSVLYLPAYPELGQVQLAAIAEELKRFVT